MYLSYSACRRTGSDALRALSVGIGLVTAGALLGGVLHQVLALALAAGVGTQSVFTAAGLAVMTYSLFLDGARTATLEPFPASHGRAISSSRPECVV